MLESHHYINYISIILVKFFYVVLISSRLSTDASPNGNLLKLREIWNVSKYQKKQTCSESQKLNSKS